MFNQLDPILNQAITEAGFQQPTQVQSETLDAALNGDDLFVSSETGSGKTAAYLLPTFEQLLNHESGSVYALLLVPTRELASQVLTQAKLLGRFTELAFGHIGGGTDIKKQSQLIKQPPHLLVATPGRLSELLARDLIDLSQVEILILDEADRLLDMGFANEILAIADHCSNRSQTMLFSATLANKKLRGLAKELQNEPTTISLNQLTDSHAAIEQEVIYADDKTHKLQQLSWLLKNQQYKTCLIFCNSKEQVDRLYGLLWQQDFSVGILHGDRDQKQRNQVMGKLRREALKILIATDIAARGLDIDGMDLVINFEMPRRGEIYLHRIGRTGRAGKSGLAISLIMASEYNLMAGIERFLKQSFKRRKIKALQGNYKGPKKLKSSGKATGSKKKKLAKKKQPVKKRSKTKK